MQNLISIQPAHVGGELTETVDARELHAALNIGRDFSTWINSRIDDYGFVENQDFIIIPNSGEKPSGLFSRGRPAKNYRLTQHMAQELCMLERSEIGRKFRQYFIAREAEAIRRGVAMDEMKTEFLRARPDYAAIIRYTDMGLQVGEIGKLMGKSSGAIRHDQIKLEKTMLLVRPVTLKRLSQEENQQMSLLGGAQ